MGAILRFAVTDSISGVDLTTVGLILLLVGVLGLLIAMFYELSYRKRATGPVVDRGYDRVVERPVERDPRY